MKFVKVTLNSTNEIVYVNLNDIRSIRRAVIGDGALLLFSTDSECSVKESVECLISRISRIK